MTSTKYLNIKQTATTIIIKNLKSSKSFTFVSAQVGSQLRCGILGKFDVSQLGTITNN